MSRKDIRDALTSAGRPLTLKELVKQTGLAPSTVSRQCFKMFMNRELSRRWQLGNGYIHFVYYFTGEKVQFSENRSLCRVSDSSRRLEE